MSGHHSLLDRQRGHWVDVVSDHHEREYRLCARPLVAVHCLAIRFHRDISNEPLEDASEDYQGPTVAGLLPWGNLDKDLS